MNKFVTLALLALMSLTSTPAFAHTATQTHMHSENIAIWIVLAATLAMTATLMWNSKR